MVAKGNRQGAFDSEEFAVLIKEVMKQDPAAFEKPMEGNDLDFKSIASCMERKRIGIRELYAGTVHPIVRRHKLGTLEKDVRGELIHQVKKNKWNLSADIEFDKLARLPQFEGHNSKSLQNLYHRTMLWVTTKRLGKKTSREVTVYEVEEWWKNSERRAKNSNLIEKQQQIVEAYNVIRQEIGFGRK